MSTTLRQSDQHNLATEIWGKYLRDERKYDAWGSQGKLLAMQETLQDNDIDVLQLARQGAEFQRLVNLVFPRTFIPQSPKIIFSAIAASMISYAQEVRSQFSTLEASPSRVEALVMEEVASRYNLQVDDVRNLIGSHACGRSASGCQP